MPSDLFSHSDAPVEDAPETVAEPEETPEVPAEEQNIAPLPEDTPPLDPDAVSPADFDPELIKQRDSVEYDVSLVTKVTAQVNGIAEEGQEEDPVYEHTVVEVEAPLYVTLTAVDTSPESPYAHLLDEHGRIELTESPLRVPGSVAAALSSLPYVKVEAAE